MVPVVGPPFLVGCGAEGLKGIAGGICCMDGVDPIFKVGISIMGSCISIICQGMFIMRSCIPIMGPGIPIMGPGIPIMGPGIPIMGPGIPIMGSGIPIMGKEIPIIGLVVIPIIGAGIPIIGPGIPIIGAEIPIIGVDNTIVGLIAISSTIGDIPIPLDGIIPWLPIIALFTAKLAAGEIMTEGIATPAAGLKGFIAGAINGSSIIFRAGVTAPKPAITGSKGIFIGAVRRPGLIAVPATGKTMASMGDGPIERYLVTDCTLTGYKSKKNITNVISKGNFFR
jgi:hypothetical protein